MKEIPILFSTPMVQAILAGRKTMTRRVVKPMPGRQSEWLTEDKINDVPHGEMAKGGWQMHHPKSGQHHEGVDVAYDSPLGWIKCPYGKPGDVLWVRESWRGIQQDFGPDRIEFKASEVIDVRGKWKPSIHMKKEVARIWLQVTDVRVERLQDITEEDAIAEGIEPVPSFNSGEGIYPGQKYNNYLPEGYTEVPALDSFESLWRSINGTDSWNANPWVWVISFEVLSTTGKPSTLTEKSNA